MPAIPVKVEFAAAALLKFPVPPEIMLQAPVPILGMFAANVALLTPHKFWSDPAFAVLGFCGNEILTLSEDAPQLVVLIVQLNIYEFPAVPVKVEVAEVVLLKVPLPPLTIAQVPLPDVGTFAANAVELLPHTIWSDPAFAVVGFCKKEIKPSNESYLELRFGLELWQSQKLHSTPNTKILYY